MVDKLRFPDLAGLVELGHKLGLSVGFYLNTCICMEKGRTYFEEDVAFLAEMKFDTVKIDQCGGCPILRFRPMLAAPTTKYALL